MQHHEYEQCVKEMWRLDKDRHKFGFTIPGRDWMSFVNVEEITDLKEGVFWSSEFCMSVTEAAIHEASFIAEMKYREHKHKHETYLLNQVFLGDDRGFGDTGIVNMRGVRKHNINWSTVDFNWFAYTLCNRFSVMNEASEIEEAMIVIHPIVLVNLTMSAIKECISATNVQQNITKFIHDNLKIQNMDRHKNVNALGPIVHFRVSPFCKVDDIFKCIIYDKSTVKINLSEICKDMQYHGDALYPTFTMYQKFKPVELLTESRLEHFEGAA